MQDKAIRLIDDIQTTIDIVAGAIGKGIMPPDIDRMIVRSVSETANDFFLTAAQHAEVLNAINTIYKISKEIQADNS